MSARRIAVAGRSCVPLLNGAYTIHGAAGRSFFVLAAPVVFAPVVTPAGQPSANGQRHECDHLADVHPPTGTPGP
jgi:hypothetical protein